MRLALPILASLSLFSAPVLAQKPDFSGTWKLNVEKSDPVPQGRMGGMRATELTIVQKDGKLTVESKMGEMSRTSTYNLDGTESKNPGMRDMQMTTTSKWVDNTIVTDGDNTVQGPMGEMRIKSHEVRSLSADGKTMTVVTTTTTPQGERTRKNVYDKA
jgi:hypothetical protein